MNAQPMPLDIHHFDTQSVFYVCHQADTDPRDYAGQSGDMMFPESPSSMLCLALTAESSMFHAAQMEREMANLQPKDDEYLISIFVFRRGLHLDSLPGDGLDHQPWLTAPREQIMDDSWPVKIFDHPDRVDGIFYRLNPQQEMLGAALFQDRMPELVYVYSDPCPVRMEDIVDQMDDMVGFV